AALLSVDAVGHGGIEVDAIPVVAKPSGFLVALLAHHPDVRARRVGRVPAQRADIGRRKLFVHRAVAIIVSAVAIFRDRRIDGAVVFAAERAVEIDEAGQAFFERALTVRARGVGVVSETRVVAFTAMPRVGVQVEVFVDQTIAIVVALVALLVEPVARRPYDHAAVATRATVRAARW